MITKAFSVRDSKANTFGVPFFAVNSAVAARMFTDLVSDVKSTVSRFPDDFTLFEVGSFDDDKGVMMPLSIPVNLGVASVFLASKLGPKEIRVPRPPDMALVK